LDTSQHAAHGKGNIAPLSGMLKALHIKRRKLLCNSLQRVAMVDYLSAITL
jgi:hypothetical protein